MPQPALVARLSVRERMSERTSAEERLVTDPSSKPLHGMVGKQAGRMAVLRSKTQVPLRLDRLQTQSSGSVFRPAG